MRCVEIEVEFEDANAGFAEKAELASECVLGDQLANFGLGEVAVFCDARDLEFSGSGRNLGIEARAGSGYEIDGNWRIRILGVELRRVGLDAVQQLVIRGREIRAGGL